MLLEDVLSLSLSQIKEDNVTKIKVLCREINKEASALVSINKLIPALESRLWGIFQVWIKYPVG